MIREYNGPMEAEAVLAYRARRGLRSEDAAELFWQAAGRIDEIDDKLRLETAALQEEVLDWLRNAHQGRNWRGFMLLGGREMRLQAVTPFDESVLLDVFLAAGWSVTGRDGVLIKLEQRT